MQNLVVTVDGEPIDPSAPALSELVRAVVISLFTWRRAAADDPLPSDDAHGWWGDTYAPVTGDQIGSRLWLLMRDKITPQTLARATQYTKEALQWLLDDAVASRVDVSITRAGLDQICIQTDIYRHDGRLFALRFDNAWRM